MSDEQFMAAAATPFVRVVRAITPGQHAARTPCAEYDVRALVNHLLFWGPSLEAAGRKQAVPPSAAAETDVVLTDGDWAGDLERHVERTVTAWSVPEAWDGVTAMGSPMELPASMIGGMVLGEFVVHGWDLARATGQEPVWDDELLEYLYVEVAKTAEQGREMGVYGPAVAVADSSPIMHRVLGLTGRDPHWTP